MRWAIFLVNTRTLSILMILTFFLFLGIFLLILEIKMKKEQKKELIRTVESNKITELKKDLSNSKSKKEKLDSINKHIKNLFKERFRFCSQKSYSELYDIFNNQKLYRYSKLCEKMFQAYYSNEEITQDGLKEIIILLISLMRENKTYVNPEEYEIDNVYNDNDDSKKLSPDNPKDPNKKDQEPMIEKKTLFGFFKTQKPTEKKDQEPTEEKEPLEKKDSSLIEKSQLSNETPEIVKLLNRDQGQLQNKRLLKQIEKKIEEQNKRLKLQEKIKKEISEKIKSINKKENELLDNQKKEISLKKELEEKEKKIIDPWRNDINAQPVLGRDWLRSRKNKRGKN
jgi:type I site-specific restriction-modification system R (restriction) subunit